GVGSGAAGGRRVARRLRRGKGRRAEEEGSGNGGVKSVHFHHWLLFAIPVTGPTAATSRLPVALDAVPIRGDRIGLGGMRCCGGKDASGKPIIRRCRNTICRRRRVPPRGWMLIAVWDPAYRT